MQIELILIFTFSFFFILENVFPKRNYTTKFKIKSYLVDTLIILFNNLLFYILSITSLYYISENVFSLNLLSFLDFNNIFVIIATLVFLDLFIYVWHVFNHKVPQLWVFHKAHHSEIYLNTLSGLRFHTGELFLSVVFKSVVLIVFLGIPINLIILAEFIVIGFSMFHHSNISFKLEKFLSKVIVMPYNHQFHHNPKKINNDNNYGVVFTLWDKLFKTFQDKETKEIGLEKTTFQSFLEFLKFGFTLK